MMDEFESAKIGALAQARRRVWWPFAAVVLLVVFVTATAALLTVGNMSVVANTLLVTLCLLPMLLIMLLLVVGVFVGIWGLSRADKLTAQRLIQLERTAAETRGRVQTESISVGNRFIGFAAAIERLEPLWSVFDPEDGAKGRSDAAQSKQSDQSSNS